MTRNSEMIQRIQSAPVRYPFSFTMLGDCGVMPHDPFEDAICATLFDQMAQLEPQPLFCVTLGDFSAGGSEAGHQKYLKLVSRISFPNICILGNHEMDVPEGVEQFHTLHGTPNFHFGYGNTLFVAVNISDYPQGPGDEDVAFLEATLREHAPEYPNRVVFIHQPPFLHGHYAPVAHWGFTKRELEFVNLLYRYDVRLLCCAHITAYDRHQQDLIRLVVSGGGGHHKMTYGMPLHDQPPYRASFHHFVQMTIHETGKAEGRVYRAFHGTQDEPQYRF